MAIELPGQEHSPPELRELVRLSVSLLGKVLEEAVGPKLYETIESIRQEMVRLRDRQPEQNLKTLRETMFQLKLMSRVERGHCARAFTLMLEVMNTCENAYRSYRLRHHLRENIDPVPDSAEKPRAIIYVLTAHPTEARAPENIAVFHLIQRELLRLLDKSHPKQTLEEQLSGWLKLAWKVSVTREKAPEVADEADHIYSTLLARPTLDSLLEASHEIVPVYVRSWVGGDKDGHPGVDEKVMHRSLTLSRGHLITYLEIQLSEVLDTLDSLKIETLRSEVARMKQSLKAFRTLKKGDGGRLAKLREAIIKLTDKYKKSFGAFHPNLLQVRRALHVFPALVVPLELRESSDVLLSDLRPKSQLAIDRMLKKLAELSQGGSPRWYARGFIISMASSLEHLKVADLKLRRAFGKAKIPVIPLFEQAAALADAPQIVKSWINDAVLGRDLRQEWGGYCEMMVGYSDSSKESGVIFSRLEIAEAMHKLEATCLAEGIKPLFFQGSGGSIDRGGGTVQDQMAWWPHSALRTYKVTMQGEMVERSLASREITTGQIRRIFESAVQTLSHPSRAPHLAEIHAFAEKVATFYRAMIADPKFLEIVGRATPYSDLGEIRIGSRPVKRSPKLSVQGLRAIPWVLCWTQTRVLFPTWWGIGSAWKSADTKTRECLKQAFAEEAVFSSYIRALGFTLAKVELSVWDIYLEHSGLDPSLTADFSRRFANEFQGAVEMVQFISGALDPLWFRPWLGASIRLRSPMIHPLNLLQILAREKKDFSLLRLTVAGISSGMMTTG